MRKIRPLALSIAVAIGIAGVSAAAPALAAELTVYKSPWCGCCAQWNKHMRANGYTPVVRNVENLDPVKKMFGVPENLQSCHTAIIDGYVIEGHVPAKDVAKLLAERPKARGLAAPGMPSGAPGMEGGAKDRYNVLLFQADGATSVYSRY